MSLFKITIPFKSSKDASPNPIVLFLVIVTLLFILVLLWTLPRGKDLNIDLDNFKVDELSEEQIGDIPNYCKGFLTSTSVRGGVSGVLNSQYSNNDYDFIRFRAKRITGIKTVSATCAKDCTLQLRLDVELKSGEMMMALVVDNEFVQFIEIGENITMDIDVKGEHIYLIKIICSDAQVELEAERTLQNGKR